MLPLLAASTVIGAIDTLASGAMSAWKAVAGGRAGGANTASSSGESFASLLSGTGAAGSGALQAAGLALPASTPSVGTGRLLSRLA